jgi:hypothetical protein
MRKVLRNQLAIFIEHPSGLVPRRAIAAVGGGTIIQLFHTLRFVLIGSSLYAEFLDFSGKTNAAPFLERHCHFAR